MTERPAEPTSEDASTRNIHDSFFKQAFSEPALAADELRQVLPPQAAAYIRWDTLTSAPPNFVDAVFRQRFGDLVFHATLADHSEALLWFLLEHQSAEHPWMPLRVTSTQSTMWEHWRAQHPHSAALPAIVPVVVYHGARPWHAATAMEELYSLSLSAQTALGEHLLRSRFLLDDLSTATDEQLRARRMDVYGRLALFAMAQAKAEDFLERLAAGWLDEIRMLARVSEGRLYALFRYTLRVNPNADHDTVKRFVTDVADDKVEKTMITASNKLIQAGIDQGRRERDEEIGKLLAQWRELTLSLLEERFGSLPQEITARVAVADASALKQWTARIHKSESLDQVFAPAP